MSIRSLAYLPFLLAVPFTAACSSSSTPATPVSDAGDDTSVPRNDAGNPGVDAAPTPEAGFDAAPLFIDGSVPQGGTPATPNSVKCGAASCATATDFCCVPTTDAGAAESCGVTSDPSACASGARQECDDSQDCPGGQICCVILDHGPFAESNCATDCIDVASAYQACRVNGECLTGEPCKVYGCGPAGTWELCAADAPLQCH